MSEELPSSLRREPFRVFFPLAFVLGAAGVAHWLLFTTGAIERYLGRFHAVTQTQAFLVAFAAGFLLTAIPKRTGTPPASWAEIGALIVLLPLVSLATLFELDALGQTAYAGSLLILAAFAIRRFIARGARRRPPASFAMVPIGFLAGLAGAVLTTRGLEGGSAFALAFGRRLVFEGVFICLALGVGAFLLPLAGRGEAAPDLAPRRPLGVIAYAAAGIGVVGSLAIEAAGWPQIGAGLRGALALAVLIASGAWRAPSLRGTNRRLLWISIWAIPMGLFAAAAFPDHRVEALHGMFIGGFGLLAFAVSTHVALGHTGHAIEQSARAWPVVSFAALFAIALGFRVTAIAVPNHYFGWLGAAAALWLLGAIVWAAYVFPKLLHTPSAER